MKTVSDIRDDFALLYQADATLGQGDAQTVELIGTSFIADEPSIFGKVNEEYIERELDWYLSMDRKISGLGEPIPQIWKNIASTKGEINSNYGWCIFSDENGSQYNNAIDAIVEDNNTRQALMIYTRPEMHRDARRDGMKDFMCTSACQMILRGSGLHYIVNARSTDAVFGYKNDYAWHAYVQNRAVSQLEDLLNREIFAADMVYNVGSLHVYQRHFHLIDQYARG